MKKIFTISFSLAICSAMQNSARSAVVIEKLDGYTGPSIVRLTDEDGAGLKKTLRNQNVALVTHSRKERIPWLTISCAGPDACTVKIQEGAYCPRIDSEYCSISAGNEFFNDPETKELFARMDARPIERKDGFETRLEKQFASKDGNFNLTCTVRKLEKWDAGLTYCNVYVNIPHKNVATNPSTPAPLFNRSPAVQPNTFVRAEQNAVRMTSVLNQ